MQIRIDDLTSAAVHTLLNEHLQFMHWIWRVFGVRRSRSGLPGKIPR